MSTRTSMALAALLATAVGAPAAAAGAQEGMVVARDADTGKLRAATPAEVKALHTQSVVRGMVQRAPAPVVTIRKNGTLQKQLGDRGMVYSVASRNADGKLDMQCVQGEEAAKAALERPANATRQEHTHEIR